jgi:hypothetical protein
MSGKTKSDALNYRITVKGKLDQQWQSWFGDVQLNYRQENTVFIASFPDNAALHGALNKIRDLNLVLLSLEYLPETSGDSLSNKPGGGLR